MRRGFVAKVAGSCASADFAGKPGETCWLTVNREKWHVFDAGDGHAYF
jgi:hypothetical protein